MPCAPRTTGEEFLGQRVALKVDELQHQRGPLFQPRGQPAQGGGLGAVLVEAVPLRLREHRVRAGPQHERGAVERGVGLLDDGREGALPGVVQERAAALDRAAEARGGAELVLVLPAL